MIVVVALARSRPCQDRPGMANLFFVVAVQGYRLLAANQFVGLHLIQDLSTDYRPPLITSIAPLAGRSASDRPYRSVTKRAMMTMVRTCIVPSANSKDIQYELNRGDGTLTYAGSTTEGSTTTTIIGSGSCEDASTEKT